MLFQQRLQHRLHVTHLFKGITQAGTVGIESGHFLL